MAIEHPDMSDGAIAATIGVARQLISRWRAPLRKAAATAASEKVADEVDEKQFAALQPSASQPATSGNAIERQRLLDLAPDQQMETLIDKILRGSAPRAAALAVGVSSHKFTKRMETDEKFQDLVLRAAHEAESSVAQNLYRMAIGNSPQAAQSAIAWLEKRLPESWGREPVHIEVSVEGGIDVNHILSSPDRIKAVNAFESAMQQAEVAQLPAHQVGDIIDLDPIEVRDPVVPALPQDDLMRVPDKLEVAPRMNRPGQGDPSKLGRTREIVVDGIRTLVVDEPAAGSDDRPPF
jgi:hypothetical protein